MFILSMVAIVVFLFIGGPVLLTAFFGRRNSWLLAGALGVFLFLLLFFGLSLYWWVGVSRHVASHTNDYADPNSYNAPSYRSNINHPLSEIEGLHDYPTPSPADAEEPSALTPKSVEPPAEESAAAATPSDTTETTSTSSDKNAQQPDWITSPPKRVGTVYRRVIQSDPFTTVDECYAQLDQLMMRATGEYLDQLVGQHQLASMGITPGYIRQKICRDEYVEKVDVRSLGVPMKQVYLLMEFDDAVQQDLRRRWKESLLGQRLAMVGAGSGLVLLLIGTVFGFFKLDTATKGFYTKRLIFGAIVVTIVAILLVAVSVAGEHHQAF